MFLIGNKLDLEEKREVSTEKAKKFAESENLNLFLECSAKSGFNAQKIFIEAGKQLYNNFLIYSSRRGSRTSSITDQSSNLGPINEKVKFPTQVFKNTDQDYKKTKKGCC